MNAPPVVEVVECPNCDAPALPSSTVCGECGHRLVVPAVPARGGDVDTRCLSVIGCSCGHTGICTLCVLHLLDNGLPL